MRKKEERVIGSCCQKAEADRENVPRLWWYVRSWKKNQRFGTHPLATFSHPSCRREAWVDTYRALLAAGEGRGGSILGSPGGKTQNRPAQDRCWEPIYPEEEAPKTKGENQRCQYIQDGVLQNLNIRLPYDSAIPLLDERRDLPTRIHAAIVTIAKKVKTTQISYQQKNKQHMVYAMK
jgi:hypothetical protein